MHPRDVATLLLKSAPAEVLMLSKLDMHVPGLDSIVLAQKRDGNLFRMYIARTDVLEQNGEAGFALGVHDHKYDITFHCVQGTVKNYVYNRADTNKRIGAALEEYKFYPFNGPEGAHTKFVGESWLSRAYVERLGPSPNFMGHTELHTIRAAKGAIWIVEESNRQVGKVSTLYTDRPVNWSGVYNTFFSAGHVIDHAMEWLSKGC